MSNTSSSTSSALLNVHTGLALHEPLLKIERQLVSSEAQQVADHTGSCLFSRMTVDAILLILMVVQFGRAFYANDESTKNLSLLEVNFSIVLFILASYIYRQCLAELIKKTDNENNDCSFSDICAQMISFLPEITIDIILGLIRFHFTAAAYVLLRGSALFMALIIAVYSSSSSNSSRNDDDEDDEVPSADDEEEYDELDGGGLRGYCCEV
jgi:hypothetical protein